MPTAYGYVRVSTDRQASEGVSLAAQAEKIRAVYESQYRAKYQWGRIEQDPGESAYKTDFCERKGAGRLLIDLARGDIVIFVSVSRAFRTMRDAVATIHALKDRGVGCVFLDLAGQTVDLDSAVGSIAFYILAWAAELEAKQRQERTKAAFDHMRSVGRRVGGRRDPWGWRTFTNWDGKKYLIPHVRQRMTMAWVERQLAGGHSHSSLVLYMNGQGMKPFAKNHPAWCNKYLERQIGLHRKLLRYEAEVGADGYTSFRIPGLDVKWEIHDFEKGVAKKIARDLADWERGKAPPEDEPAEDGVDIAGAGG